MVTIAPVFHLCELELNFSCIFILNENLNGVVYT